MFATVRRDGRRGLWSVSPAAARKCYEDLFQLREEELAAANLPPNSAWMPFENQKKVQRALREKWAETPRAKEVIKQLANRDLSCSMRIRTLESYYRRQQYDDYGGREWCNILIALGTVPERIVHVMNEIAAERRASWDAEDRATPQVPSHKPYTSLKREAREDPDQVMGIRHKTTAAMELRKKAHGLGVKIKKEEAKWEKGESKMGIYAWQGLLGARDKAWGEAEAVSDKMGEPHKHRKGEMCNVRDRDMVSIELSRYVSVLLILR